MFARLTMLFWVLLWGTATVHAQASADAQGGTDLRVPAPAAPVALQFSIIKTSDVTTLEGLLYQSGSLFKQAKVNHVAVLVRHPQGSFMWDTGLGRTIDQHIAQDMPWWAKPLFRYGPVLPVRRQLEQAGEPLPQRIILSHTHWDHSAALDDFPEAQVWLNRPEIDYVASRRGLVFPSRVVQAGPRWKKYDFTAKRYAGFPQSLDLFGDGSAVLVLLGGHTPGSTGLMLTPASGTPYFFVGDAVWRAEAIDQQSPKSYLASKLVDDDGAATLGVVAQLHALQLANPRLVFVPAHDAQVHDQLGYFPNWVK
jgi:glyoxylase-like metal-dependent hydrolase (beta-lactamase superfamily II)